MNNTVQYSVLIGLFSILLASGISSGVSAIPDHVPNIAKAKAGPFAKTFIETENLKAVVQPLYTVPGNPTNYETAFGGPLDGAGALVLTRSDFTVGCTGGLLWTGEHVLTAAHCVTDDSGNNIFLGGTVTFEGDNGSQTIDIDASSTIIHNDWNGDVLKGNDLAILKLVSQPTSDIERYDIDRNGNDDVGSIVDKVGYGISGTGTSGSDSTTYPFGVKRDGNNKYDDVADTMLQALGLQPNIHFVPGSVLQYDFDNGAGANDAFGFFFNNNNLGLGSNEVNSASGDSGGPAIHNGNIIGITSYGITLSFTDGTTSDITSDLDSSFGEFSGDTRVSTYANFIDNAIGGTTDDGTTDDGTTDGGSTGPGNSGNKGGGNKGGGGSDGGDDTTKCSPGKEKRGLC